MSASSRETILARVRQATAGSASVHVVRAREASPLDGDSRRELFLERLREYGTTVVACPADELHASIDQVLREHDVAAVAVAPGLEEHAQPTLRAISGATREDLASAAAVVTECAIAVAESGTVILNTGPGQGSRLLTLLPPLHVCVVKTRQIVETLPEAFEVLEEYVKASAAPLTFISGPSATTDIGLERVVGVHGVQRLVVVLVDEEQAS